MRPILSHAALAPDWGREARQKRWRLHLPCAIGAIVIVMAILGCAPAPAVASIVPVGPPAVSADAPGRMALDTAAAIEPPAPGATPAPTPTPDPYAGLGIADLASRSYGGGALRIERVLAASDAFTRTLVTYPSDGVSIAGFMNVPTGKGPFPVVIVVHGYVEPSRYRTLTYTTRYADALARAGYVAIHPNLRGYKPSGDGPNPFRIGMALDVLNLAALVRQQGGKPGPLAEADPHAIGLWGHSMGGGISLRAITIDRDLKAAVLYGAMSGDERANHEKILAWSGGTRGREELKTPEEALRRISPIYHLDRIRAAVSIHHGARDATVPPEWSLDLCDKLGDLDKTVECFGYAGQPHTFTGEGDRLFIRRTVEFFDRYLKDD